jgi:hypothetical protein
VKSITSQVLANRRVCLAPPMLGSLMGEDFATSAVGTNPEWVGAGRRVSAACPAPQRQHADNTYAELVNHFAQLSVS